MKAWVSRWRSATIDPLPMRSRRQSRRASAEQRIMEDRRAKLDAMMFEIAADPGLTEAYMAARKNS